MQRRRFCFFDLDGTLADTDPDIRGAWKAALADLGLDCPSFDEKFVAGPPIDEMARILFPEAFTQELADAIRVRFASHYDNDGFPETREYPGVMDEVRRLKAEGRVLAIVTNKRFVAATAMARHFGWDRVFDGVFAGDMSTPKVRKPELLARVMAHYDVTRSFPAVAEGKVLRCPRGRFPAFSGSVPVSVRADDPSAARATFSFIKRYAGAVPTGKGGQPR